MAFTLMNGTTVVSGRVHVTKSRPQPASVIQGKVTKAAKRHHVKPTVGVMDSPMVPATLHHKK